MKKKKSLLLLICVFAISIVSAVVAITTASADTNITVVESFDLEDLSRLDGTDLSREDGPLELQQGMTVSLTTQNKMSVTLYLDGTEGANFKNRGGIGIYTYNFGLFRVDGNKATPCALVSYGYNTKTGTSEQKYTDINQDIYGSQDITSVFYGENNTFLSFTTGENGHDYQTKIYFNVQSTTAQYFVACKFGYIGYLGKVPRWNPDPFSPVIYYDQYADAKVYSVYSDIRSYKEVLENLQDSGTDFSGSALASYFGEVLGYTAQSTTVVYLEEIAGTPFAKRKEQTVSIVRASDEDELDTDTVENALGKSTKVLLSIVKKFELDEDTGKYIADYSAGAWLESRLPNGNATNFFLDPNQSYYDFYHRFVTDNIFSNNLYEYIYYTEILSKFPTLGNMSPQNLYGYWGYVVAPQTSGINSAWKQFLNEGDKVRGITKTFTYDESLNGTSYNKLLADYNYGWLSIAWNDLTQYFQNGGTYMATHYILYADCTTNETVLSQNGSAEVGDHNGLIRNDIENGATVLIRSVSDVFGSKGLGSLVVELLGIFIIIVVLYYIFIKQPKGGKKKK